LTVQVAFYKSTILKNEENYSNFQKVGYLSSICMIKVKAIPICSLVSFVKEFLYKSIQVLDVVVEDT
jgi:hypothetical protein